MTLDATRLHRWMGGWLLGAWLASVPLRAATPPLPTPCAGGACGTSAASTPFVTSGQATVSTAGSALTVNQTTNSTILNWRDFNVANGSAVTFNQPAATAQALNRIWSADPSVIAGRLNANGQIYLLNQNGIVFAGGAQVNVGALTASTLNITDSLFESGVLSRNFDTSSPQTQPAIFQAGSGAVGNITVNQGAEIRAADGGRIVLLAPQVTNAGNLITPDGQTLLGAGRSVFLAASTDPALRGLLIEVGANGLAADSSVRNSGQITAERGNVTLAGLVVNQAGRISATTSVNANGSIYLVAGDTSSSTDTNFYYNKTGIAGFGAMLPNFGGKLTLEAGSVTEIGADTASTATITDQQTFLPSQVGLVGGQIGLLGNASIRAPGAVVTVQAAADPFGQQTGGQPPIAADGSRIYLDAGSTIDVSGLKGVAVSATRDIATIRLEGADLQDDPLLRDGFLHGQTVTVNLNQGSTLFDVTPYRSNLSRGIEEKLTTAGSIRLNSWGDVITRAGSTLDVSGGSIAYQRGVAAATTKLLGADGGVYDIATAPKDILYTGLANSFSYVDPTWGTTVNQATRATYMGYMQGQNAGQIDILGARDYLRGTALALTQAGLFQRAPGTLPAGGTFNVGDSTAAPGPSNSADLRAPGITLADTAADTLGVVVDPFSLVLPTALASTLTLSTDVIGNGFSNLGLFSNGTVLLPQGVSLGLQGAGRFTATGRRVEVDGQIIGPGAAVSLTATTTGGVFGGPNDVVLGPGGRIDVSGNWTNDSPLVTAQPGTAPLLYNGGSVVLNALDSVRLASGSLIDTSGGAWINTAGKLTAGAAGSLSLGADVGRTVVPYAGTIDLGGTLSAASLKPGAGGVLTLRAGTVTVGTAAAGTTGELWLTPQFFTQGGFSAYRITGVAGVTLGTDAAPVTIAPLQQNLMLSAGALTRPTGSDLDAFSTLQTLPDWQRAATSVSFTATASDPTLAGRIGNVTLGRGSSLITDPGASVQLTAGGYVGNLTVLGSIIAPAGSIALSMGTDSTDSGYFPGLALTLGANSLLSATGYAQVNTQNSLGLRQGSVLAGGTVSLAAKKGAVVTMAGSVIDVSGAAGVIDLIDTHGVTPTVMAGNAGSIAIDARESLVLGGSLRGTAAPVAGAGGGSLSIGLDLFSYSLTQQSNLGGAASRPFPTAARTLTLGTAAAAAAASVSSGAAVLDAAALQSGGFDNLTLKSTDVIALGAGVSLGVKGSLVLDAPVLRGTSGSSNIAANYVGLGNYYNVSGATQQNVSQAPAGSATLGVQAQQIDVRGDSALSGFASIELASAGDLRLAPGQSFSTAASYPASLHVSGDLTLRAAQIYPVTGTAFAISSVAPNGTISVARSTGDTPAVPLSAQGSLTLSAPHIVQAGVLRAPLGQITLNGTDITLASGSLTSVSAEGTLIPYGTTLNGLQWVHTAGGNSSLIDAPLAKQININGANVDIASGAQLNLAGGGDLYAYEFIAGQGGSKDVLDPTTGTYTYAILPSLRSGYAPIDPQYQQGSKAPAGGSIQLSGVPGLADGAYTLLPARYALLPGAYAIRVVKANSDQPSRSSAQQADGSYLAAARFGVSGRDVLDSRTSTVLVVPASVVRTQSGYTDTAGNDFFSQAGAPLSADAGQLQLAASTRLDLAGAIDFAAAAFASGVDADGHVLQSQGAGGEVSVVAPAIAVVDALTGATGTLELKADSLDALGAQSILLGATRRRGTDGDMLSVGSQSVVVRNTQAHTLTAPEIVLAATSRVSVDAGGALAAQGTLATDTSPLLISGDGALLRLASGDATTVVRSALPTSPAGLLLIGAGSHVSATGSLLLDAAGSTTVASDASVHASAVTVSSSRVSLGDVPASVSGLNFTSQLLSSLQGLRQLTLDSSSTIDFYGAVQLGTIDTATQQPLLQNVILDAAALNGYGAGDKSIVAGGITLQNSGASGGAATTPTGVGALQLVARTGRVISGSGQKTLTGFGGVNVTAAEFVGSGVGGLNLAGAGDLAIASARVDTTSGATQSLNNASGAVNFSMASSANALPVAAPGGRLSVTATTIAQNGNIELPSGALALHATTGDVTFGNASHTGVAAVAKDFADTAAVTPAGQVLVSADSGSVRLLAGSVLDLSGTTASNGLVADAGVLSVSVPRGTLELSGSLLASAPSGGLQGDFSLDAASIDNFSALNTRLNSAGFTGARTLRARSGNLLIGSGDVVRSSRFSLSADAGAIDIAGSIDTRAGDVLSSDGGAISLWSDGDLLLRSGASLLADGGAAGRGSRPASGGAVTLATAAGSLDLQPGSIISSTGGVATSDGLVTLRAPRTADNLDVRVAEVGARIASRRPLVIEGVKTYSASVLGPGTGAGSTLGTDGGGSLYTETQNFAASAGAIAARLGVPGAQIRPGIEVQSSGDLTLAGTWNLGDTAGSSWHLAGAPVNLTLRAAGNLLLAGSLSDGFQTDDLSLDPGLWNFVGGDSAAYRLTAGADLAAANPLAAALATAAPISQGKGDFILEPGNLVRTGNGSIEIAAGGSVKLGFDPAQGDASYLLPNAQASVIYTAGVPSVLTAAQQALFTDPLGLYAASYARDGGDITLTAAKDVRAAPSNQLVSDWLWRRGSTNADGTIADGDNVSWWVDLPNFQQGIGALGGGNIRLAAGGSIVNVSAVIPTTGRLLGAANSRPDIANLLVDGGGTLRVRAGGNVSSGLFETDRGNAQIVAGDAVNAGRHQQDTNTRLLSAGPLIYPIIAMGDSETRIYARTGITLDGVFNSTATPATSLNNSSVFGTGADSYFFTYGFDPGSASISALNVSSVAGDVRLNNNTRPSVDGSVLANLSPDRTKYNSNYDASNLATYPARVSVVAFSGDLYGGSTIVFPSGKGNVTLLADGNLTPSNISMSEADPTLVPSVLHPAVNLAAAGDGGGDLSTIPLPETPLHAGDLEPIRIVARTGSILGGGVLQFPKAAEVIAGQDIRNLTLRGKNMRPGDVTLIEAGGDITYTTKTDSTTNQLIANSDGIDVAGPGYLELLAGGGIDLGDSAGVVTSGNLNDSRLAKTGASLLVGAGFGSADSALRQPAYQAFVDKYLGTATSDRSAQLSGYLVAIDPKYLGISSTQTLAAFESLPRSLQLPLIARVLSDELSETGLAHNRDGSDYQRGYTAIDTLFPKQDAAGKPVAYAGNIDLFFSQLKTESGGDISLLTPGGSVIVGLPNPPAALTRLKSLGNPPVPAAANLGILVLGSGAVHGFADDSFAVNQSRILTLEGGDIILWASNGDIDAGKGAKTASGAPPPVIQTDPRGNVFVNPLNSVTGSGIGQLLTRPGLKAGLVNLIAPKGTVNAGDAGIRVAGNLNIAAVRVIGASNITVGGTATGVPVSDAGALSGALSGANALGDATKGVADLLNQSLADAADLRSLSDSLKPVFIVVRMFCLGLDCQIQ